MRVFMEKVDLNRYKTLGILGSGADYEVRAAVDQRTGQQVVLKRPKPQLVSRQLHQGVEDRTERILQVYQEVGHTIPHVSPILGYTDRAIHDAYFGESLGQEYRVMVEVRAQGIPLVGDPMARITGVPISVAHNLFALFPLAHQEGEAPFTVQQQLLDLEEGFYQVGHVLLDLRPQNVFFQPATSTITVIDCGALLIEDREREGSPAADTRLTSTRRNRGPQRDIHDFYLEMLKFYTIHQEPPTQVRGYRDIYGQRPVVRFEPDLEEMGRNFRNVPDVGVRETALSTIDKVRRRAYGAFTDFRRDLTTYFEAVKARNQNLSRLPQARKAWVEALDLLKEGYWRRYLFEPDTDLAPFRTRMES